MLKLDQRELGCAENVAIDDYWAEKHFLLSYQTIHGPNNYEITKNNYVDAT